MLYIHFQFNGVNGEDGDCSRISNKCSIKNNNGVLKEWLNATLVTYFIEKGSNRPYFKEIRVYINEYCFLHESGNDILVMGMDDRSISSEDSVFMLTSMMRNLPISQFIYSHKGDEWEETLNFFYNFRQNIINKLIFYGFTDKLLNDTNYNIFPNDGILTLETDEIIVEEIHENDTYKELSSRKNKTRLYDFMWKFGSLYHKKLHYYEFKRAVIEPIWKRMIKQ